MILKKNIIILSNFADKYSLDGIKIILRSKYFNLKSIVVTKKSKKFKFNFLKDVKVFYEGFPHKNLKIIKFIKNNDIKICICLGFQNRIRSTFIKLFKEKIYNIHPAVLPFDKGSHSAFYTIMNNNLIGSTLHIVNDKFDSGPIVDQIKEKNSLNFNAKVVHKKSRYLGLKLLKKNLGKIYFEKYKIKKNYKTKVNFKKEIVKASTLYHNKKYSGEYLWRLIRAVNFKKNGFYIKFKKKNFKIIPTIDF